MNALVTLSLIVPIGYGPGDYAKLFANGGSGAVNWTTPVSQAIYELFPDGAGIFGFGHAPWGHFSWGRGQSQRTDGFGHLPWGHFPFGYGTAIITAAHKVTACGAYKFAFGCYDSLGNQHQGTPQELAVDVHIAPAAPTTLAKNSYNKTSKVLVLDAA